MENIKSFVGVFNQIHSHANSDIIFTSFKENIFLTSNQEITLEIKKDILHIKSPGFRDNISHGNGFQGSKTKNEVIYSKYWLINTTQISRLIAWGEGNITINTDLFLPSAMIMCVNYGNINIKDTTFETLKIKLSHQGTINLNKSKINELEIDNTGIGDIYNFNVLKSGKFFLSGPGNITGNSAKRIGLDTVRIGSGKLTLGVI